MRKYGESKTTGIMMATVPHVTSGLGLRKFQADGFLLTRVYMENNHCHRVTTQLQLINIIIINNVLIDPYRLILRSGLSQEVM